MGQIQSPAYFCRIPKRQMILTYLNNYYKKKSVAGTLCSHIIYLIFYRKILGAIKAWRLAGGPRQQGSCAPRPLRDSLYPVALQTVTHPGHCLHPRRPSRLPQPSQGKGEGQKRSGTSFFKKVRPEVAAHNTALKS